MRTASREKILKLTPSGTAVAPSGWHQPRLTAAAIGVLGCQACTIVIRAFPPTALATVSPPRQRLYVWTDSVPCRAHLRPGMAPSLYWKQQEVSIPARR